MKLGICTWAFAWSAGGRREVNDLCRIAAAAGFCSLEGAFAMRGAINLQAPPPAALPIPIASLATLEMHRFALTDANPRRQEQANRAIAELIECAAAWGIPSVSISPGVRAGAQPSTSDVERIIPVISAHAVTAEKLGVKLCLENVPNHMLSTRESMAEALAALPSVGLCLDVGNALVDLPVIKWWEEFESRITKIHISDGRFQGDWSAVPLGQGDIVWDEVRSCLETLHIGEVFVESPWDGKTEEGIFVHQLAENCLKLLG